MVNKISFNPEEFYSRQRVIAELGSKGQEKLRRSKVVVVGLGGLGSVSTLYLALAGVGYLRLVDLDTVELHNLHRQVLYNLNDLRHPKVEIAAKKIQLINPSVEVEPIPDNLMENNVEEIVRGMDCVVDGLDNMWTRYIINRACVKYKVPYVFGAAIGLEGNLSVFTPPDTPCLECVLPNLDDSQLPTCDIRGVLGATTGIIGTMQAMETIKTIAGIGNTLKGVLMFCDFRDMRFSSIDIFKRPDCSVCQGKVAERVVGKERLVWLCGRNTANINPPKPINIDLNEAYKQLRRYYKFLVKSSFALVFEFNSNIEVSLFRLGRMLIKNAADEDAALKVYREIIEKLGIKISLN